jgi:hypothetical protein
LGVWWTIFTIVDLYIGLIVLDSLASSVPPEKIRRLQMAKKVILGLLLASGIVLVLQLLRRH